MATLKIDELNIVEYFSEMDLPETEIDKRVSLAYDLREVIARNFVIYDAMRRVEQVDAEYLKENLRQGYMDALANAFDSVDEYYEDFVMTSTESVIETTIKGGDTSEKRAESIAKNDTNVFANYNFEQEMVEQGYTQKRWETMLDSRVRHTHMMVDGTEIGINETFDVGVHKMRFPMDTLYGATAEEIVGCRCVCKYFK